MAFLLIGGLWGIEFALTKRLDERIQEESIQNDRRSKHTFAAMGFARYLISWHVVLYNFYPSTSSMSSTAALFASWGKLAAPVCFLFSGFLHSYSKASGPRAEEPEDWLYGMLRRVRPWYPLYLLCLIVCALQNASITPITPVDAVNFLSSVLLFNGVIWPDGYGFPYLLGTWWLCLYTVYLFLFTPLQIAISSCTNSELWTLFTMGVVLSVPIAVFDWVFEFDEVTPWLTVSYWPNFVMGQALAIWFLKNCMVKDKKSTERRFTMRPMHELPLTARFGTTICVLVLGVFFFTFPPDGKLPWPHVSIEPLVSRGMLLPLLSLFVVGLACEVDPIAKLFARAPLRWLEKFSFTNFIFQVPIHNLVKRLTGWEGLSWTFVGSLICASVVGHYLLERPWRMYLELRQK
mmetsp:Transcript_43076/g.109472  ORF Transcript_43076/g.109472 Transcript_43076/m.109472 type:complete len:405 (+) Transcript_43076:1-1215(+)